MNRKILAIKWILLFLMISILFTQADSILNKEKQCKCRSKAIKRVVGGHQLSSGYPWVVVLFTTNFKYPNYIKEQMNIEDKMKFFSCGGTILNERWIMTAGHCIPNSHDVHIKIGYGSTDMIKLFDMDNNWVKRIIVHPHYGLDENRHYLLNDIALLELERPIVFNHSSVQPACIGAIDRDLYPDKLTIIGHGAQDPVMTDLETKVESRSNISRFLKQNFIIDESDKFDACQKYSTIICGNNVDHEASSCFGDSGGGTIWENKETDKAYVVGLVSGSDQVIVMDHWLFMCAGGTYYMRVNKYLDFIEEYIGKDYCSEVDY